MFKAKIGCTFKFVGVSFSVSATLCSGHSTPPSHVGGQPQTRPGTASLLRACREGSRPLRTQDSFTSGALLQCLFFVR